MAKVGETVVQNPTINYKDRLTAFKNSINSVTKAMSQSEWTPFIEFSFGGFRVATHANTDYFMQLDFKYSGAGSANEGTINLVYVPQPYQDPNKIDKALSGVTAEHKTCRLRFGYSGIVGYDLVTKEYNCTIIKYSSTLREGCIYYTINVISSLVTLRETRGSFPAFKDENPITIARYAFETFLPNYRVYYESDVWSNAEFIDLEKQDDVNVFEYVDALLSQITDRKNPTANYWYEVRDVHGEETITFHRTVVASRWLDNGVGKQTTSYSRWEENGYSKSTPSAHSSSSHNSQKLGTETVAQYDALVSTVSDNTVVFTFDWGGNHQDNKTNNLIYAFETEYDGTVNIALVDDVFVDRTLIGSDGQAVTVRSPEDVNVAEVVERDVNALNQDWAKASLFVYGASLQLQGIPEDIPIGAVITVNPIFYGWRHHTAGKYMITGASANITNGGFITNLNLLKLSSDAVNYFTSPEVKNLNLSSVSNTVSGLLGTIASTLSTVTQTGRKTLPSPHSDSTHKESTKWAENGIDTQTTSDTTSSRWAENGTTKSSEASDEKLVVNYVPRDQGHEVIPRENTGLVEPLLQESRRYE